MTQRLQQVIAFIFFMVFSISVTAQYNRNENKIWKFGKQAGIDFNTTPPQTFLTGITNSFFEGSATLSDQNGDVLFHTDGTIVWDATEQIMPNGVSLTGFPMNTTTSTTQGAVVVPVPDSAGQYFIFSMPEWSFSAYFGKLVCSKVNMSLNNGKGDVDTSFPYNRVILDSMFTERMTVVANCEHSWLLLLRRDTIEFKAYKITSSGLDLQNPVISRLGNFPAKNYRQGTLKASHDGKKLINSLFRANVSAGEGVEMYDFDPETGIVSNAQVLDSFSSYAAEFSPDNSKVYVHFAGILTTSCIYQYDLSLPTWQAVQQSKTFLGFCSPVSEVRLAPDSRIYFNRHFTNTKILGSINNPNLADTNCNFQDTTLILPGVATVIYGFPQTIIIEPLISSKETAYTAIDSVICPIFDPFQVKVTGKNIVWNDNSTDSIKTINTHGTYYVRYNDPCPKVDTFIFRNDFPTWFITVNEKVLGTSSVFNTYQWYNNGQAIPGATNSTYTVNQNGWYSVEVTLNDCSDTLSYLVDNATSTNNINSYEIIAFPNPFNDVIQIDHKTASFVKIADIYGRIVIEQSLQNNTINTSKLPSGMYQLMLTDINGFIIGNKKMVKNQ